MKINKFVITNFQSLKGTFEVPINADESLNLITAENNGAGKSSIIQAFYFLVCNTTSSNIESFVNWDSDSMSLHLDFDYNGSNFVIDYSWDNGKVEKTLIVDKESFTGPANVNKKLKELIDSSIFMSATALLQGEKNFVKVKDSERRDHLKKVFDTDYSQEIKVIEKEIKELEDTQLKAQEKKLIELNSKEIKDKELIINCLTVDQFNVIQKESEELAQTISQLTQSILDIEKNKKLKEDTASSIEKNKASLELTKTKISVLEKEISYLESYKRDETTLTQLSTELADIKIKRIRDFSEDLIIQYQKEIANVSADIRVLEKEIQDCKNGTCPTCGKEFDAHDISKTEEKIIELKDSKKQTEELLKVQQEEKVEFDKITKANQEAISKKSLLENRISSEKLRLDKLDETNTTLLMSKKDSLDSEKYSMGSFSDVIKDLEDKLSKVSTEDAQQLIEKKVTIERKKVTINSSIKDYESIEAMNSLITKENTENVAKRLELEIDKSNVKKSLDELQEKKVGLEKIKIFLKKEFPSYVISSVISNIEVEMNTLIDKIYYKSLDVCIEGNDDVISVTYGTGKKKVDCVHASGAEEALLSLAYAYALNKMNGFNILFMDEVDAQMNDTNAMQLAEIVCDLKSDFENIWVISHNTKCKDYYASNGANVVNV